LQPIFSQVKILVLIKKWAQYWMHKITSINGINYPFTLYYVPHTVKNFIRVTCHFTVRANIFLVSWLPKQYPVWSLWTGGHNLTIPENWFLPTWDNFTACRSQKRKKIQLSHQYLFTLLGSASVKAARRTLMKLSPDPDPKRVKRLTTWLVFYAFGLCMCKSCA